MEDYHLKTFKVIFQTAKPEQNVMIWEVFIGEKHDGQKQKHIKYPIPKRWDKILGTTYCMIYIYIYIDT